GVDGRLFKKRKDRGPAEDNGEQRAEEQQAQQQRDLEGAPVALEDVLLLVGNLVALVEALDHRADAIGGEEHGEENAEAQEALPRLARHLVDQAVDVIGHVSREQVDITVLEGRDQVADGEVGQQGQQYEDAREDGDKETEGHGIGPRHDVVAEDLLPDPLQDDGDGDVIEPRQRLPVQDGADPPVLLPEPLHHDRRYGTRASCRNDGVSTRFPVAASRKHNWTT